MIRNCRSSLGWDDRSHRYLWLVFTSDGVVVRVVIRRIERYDLVKIKPTDSEAEHWFCLCLRCLRSSENCIVGSGSGRINQCQCLIPDFAIGWFFRFRLQQSSLETFWFFRLWFRRAYDSAYDSDFRFSLSQKLSYAYDSDSVELMTLLTTPIFNFH